MYQGDTISAYPQVYHKPAKYPSNHHHHQNTKKNPAHNLWPIKRWLGKYWDTEHVDNSGLGFPVSWIPTKNTWKSLSNRDCTQYQPSSLMVQVAQCWYCSAMSIGGEQVWLRLLSSSILYHFTQQHMLIFQGCWYCTHIVNMHSMCGCILITGILYMYPRACTCTSVSSCIWKSYCKTYHYLKRWVTR